METLFSHGASSPADSQRAMKLKEFDCCPLGLFTRIVYVPGPPRVMIIWNDVLVTFWICVPLRVEPPPAHDTVTVKPPTKLVPDTVIV
jgi:hypothetical protein